jgi:crotonobetainyl-CoA:carnitine CoA-transferase CaiB-like acyl-CoA transferase
MTPDQCPVLDWAASGAMALTGFPRQPPLASPAGSFALLQRVTDELTAVTRAAGTEVRADPAELIAGRAGALGLSRQGQLSAGRATRLLRAADGWCALTLSRAADLEALPAVLGVLGLDAPALAYQLPLEGGGLDEARAVAWQAVATAAASHAASDVAAAARLLGLPAAALPSAGPDGGWPPWRESRIAAPSSTARLDGAVVADLSAMWAGPLCARLLGLAGARVIKVESADRPDGARSGDQRFYHWLHAGHESLVIPFDSGHGRSVLAGLLRVADVVIEASRPRALAQRGLAPGSVPHKDGQVWLSITGYGRHEPERVAFGDDAAVAGGLVGWAGNGEPAFCADAIADPLTGITGALAVARSLAGGGGQLIDLPMRAVAARFAAAAGPDHGEHEVSPDGSWVSCPALGRRQAVVPPRPPAPAPGRAAAPGADTEAILAWLDSGQHHRY